MKSISDIDKNFKTSAPPKSDAKFYDISEKPFKIYGVFKPENDSEYIRLPRDVAKETSEGVEALNINTAGGRVRFKTNSKYIILRCLTKRIEHMAHMPLTGVSGFDVYADGGYAGTAIPPDSADEGFDAVIEFADTAMRDIVINFPLYSGVCGLLLGLENKSEVREGNLYRQPKPVVFYGSSITQGGCASRPGNAYESVLSRRMDFDFINLGFSGSAKGEDSIADYIADLDMSVFVYDYDHNAPSCEHLKNTHYRMYKKIRDKHPDMPIIMASRPIPCDTNWKERIEIIKETLKRAKDDGDKNIYFINGQDMFNSHDCNMMSVDGCHPNDFGFYCMAEAFEKILRQIM